MTTAPALYTIETMPSENSDRLELVAGRIVPKVSPVSLHARIQLRLGAALLAFADEHDIGAALTELSLILHRNPDTVRIPDLVFISYARLPNPNTLTFGTVPPELAIEITSPSNTWTEMNRKIKEYFDFGIDRVWIVDAEQHLLYVYESADHRITLTESDTVQGDGILSGFSYAIKRLFELRPGK